MGIEGSLRIQHRVESRGYITECWLSPLIFKSSPLFTQTVDYSRSVADSFKDPFLESYMAHVILDLNIFHKRLHFKK